MTVDKEEKNTISKDNLIKELQILKDESSGDPEAAHGTADMLLLSYIDDVDITKAFAEIEKWYA
jgi:hypothetical protein